MSNDAALARILLSNLHATWDEEAPQCRRERELLDVIAGRARFVGVAHAVAYPPEEADEDSAMCQEAAWDLAE